jgi:putative transposase
VQACIVHLIRHSLDLVSWKDCKPAVAALKAIYRALNADAGQAAQAAFAEGPWGRKYPAIVQSWRRHWGEIIPFYAFPSDVRRISYTTNAIEALHAKLHCAIRARGHFPHDDAVLKLLFLFLSLPAKEWRMPARQWTTAKASSPSSSRTASSMPDQCGPTRNS